VGIPERMESLMSKFSSRAARVTLCVLAALFMLAAPAAAKSSAPTISGRTTGRADYAFTTSRCSFVEQKFDLDVTPKAMPSTHLTIDVCVDSSANYPMNGTFKLTAGKSTLRGTAAGSFTSITKNPTRFTLTLTVTKSGGSFHRVHGTLTLKGKWTSDLVSMGPVTGTLRSALK
jgi:hypothetical protein